jgi:uncharacterized protein with NAD-binding domain and iron-sulfur cluster
MISSSLPYVPDDLGLSVACQPFDFTDAQMASFMLDCGAQQLNALLDTYLNTPSQGRYDYRCLAADGKALAVMIMAQMTVDVRNPDGQLYGSERYSELSFWIPCYDRQAWQQRREFKPALFLPFLFPDSFTAIATGREMFGFRKQLAQFSYPSGKLDPLHPSFTASTVGFKTFGADSKGQPYNIVSLAPAGGESLLQKLEGEAEDAAEQLISRYFGKKWSCSETGELLGDIANDFLEHCPAVFLKQFPSIGDARAAELSTIASAPFKLLKFRSAGVWLDGLQPQKFALRFEKLASHPFVELLGLTPNDSDGNAETVDVSGFWVDVDFALETGETNAVMKPPKRKIAVLGGGLGSLAAVYGITQEPGWQEKYDITLYQLGWRLGGKGASGRNRKVYDRIEEHGLHIWCGYYENAFNMIQNSYAELARAHNAPLRDWTQAFKKHSTIVLEECVGGRWHHWPLVFKPNNEVPGVDEPKDDRPHVFFAQLVSGFEWLEGELRKHLANSEQSRSRLVQHLADRHQQPLGERVFGTVAGLFAKPVESALEHEIETLFSAFSARYKSLPTHHQEGAFDQLDSETLKGWQDLIEELRFMVVELLQPFAEAIDALYDILTMLELGLAVARGVLADGVLIHGYKAINQWDFVEWLERNGCSARAANSAAVRSFYDLVLGFPNGQNEIVCNGAGIGGNVSAGELLHAYILVALCYKGAVMWKMQAGMGDTVMTPLYQVLKQRGVRFEFFHQVSQLHLDDSGSRIGAIDINVQATLKPGLTEYNPLYDVKGLPCWPSTPLYEQLVQGEQLEREDINLESAWTPWQPVAQKTLKLGEDFDEVVLGISVAALPYLTGELMAKSEPWRLMLEKASTTASQALQLWMDVTLEETGWRYASPVLDAYAEPFNTWAAMDQTLDKENWPQNALPFTIAYLCNNMKDDGPLPPFSDHGYPARMKARVEQDAQYWLQRYAGHLWPFASDQEGALDWNRLVDPAGNVGPARLASQYVRANVDPTERYVCNAANTNQYRLKADGSGFGNLVLTGDWIDNGSLNLGCVESTVIAGLQAARALTGYPVPIRRDGLLG